ncbi:protein FAM243-like [Chiloscyllium plagiosum]|uniref:protein FAM243-like n=1 Tax=Chiloscyllium plagiosum TaxID=36176 RepID=UPI001CB7FECE|nr:protein FAM243-like [Chiloscyllium plagiosum]
MPNFTKLLLRSKMYSNELSSLRRHQCLQYLKTLRNFQNDGLYTVYLGETHVSENLITGDIFCSIVKSKSPSEGLTLIHAGGARGWVPWQYRVFFQSREQWTSPKTIGTKEEIFKELCQVLSKSYGKCTVVIKPKQSVISSGLKHYTDDSSEILPQKTDVIQNVPLQTSSTIQIDNISCCPKIAQNYGHELLYFPPSYPHLSPLESAWSSLKWTVINNRKDYTATAFPNISDYQCIHLKALIENAIEGVTPYKWKAAFSRVKKWENRYIYSQA